MDLGIPSQRQHVGSKTVLVSPFDSRIKLCINPADFDFHIEFPMLAAPADLEDATEQAYMRGYVVDTGADLYEQAEIISEDTMRIYLVPAEAVRDTPLEENLPDLSTTAYGPFSGFMEAVSA